MKTSPVSLYYKLFLLFGLSFIAIIVIFSLMLNESISATHDRYSLNLLTAAAQHIADELGEHPSSEAIRSAEQRYGVDILSSGAYGVRAKVGSTSYSLRNQPAHLEFTTDSNLWKPILAFTSVMVVLLINSLLVRRLLAPIEQMTGFAREYSQGNFAGRMNIESGDEIGSLARTFNSMAERIQSQLESLKHMAVGVSHEIRSPLSRMRLAIESIEEARTHSILANELHNIDSVIELTLEREALESGLSELSLQSMELKELAEELADYYRHSGFEITVQGVASEIIADRRRIEMLLKNVIDNSFQHSASKEPVHIDVQTSTSGVSISIRDKGKGFTNVAQGLGLRLCDSIARAHEGTFVVTSELGQGTVAILTLPRFVR